MVVVIDEASGDRATIALEQKLQVITKLRLLYDSMHIPPTSKLYWKYIILQ